jgi:hypothetical protein
MVGGPCGCEHIGNLGNTLGSIVGNFLGTQWEHGANHQNPNKISNSPLNMQIILIPKKRLEACVGGGEETHWELGKYIGSMVGNLFGTQWEHGGNHQNPNKTSNSPPKMQIILIPKTVPHHFWPRLKYTLLLGWGPNWHLPTWGKYVLAMKCLACSVNSHHIQSFRKKNLLCFFAKNRWRLFNKLMRGKWEEQRTSCNNICTMESVMQILLVFLKGRMSRTLILYNPINLWWGNCSLVKVILLAIWKYTLARARFCCW